MNQPLDGLTTNNIKLFAKLIECFINYYSNNDTIIQTNCSIRNDSYNVQFSDRINAMVYNFSIFKSDLIVGVQSELNNLGKMKMLLKQFLLILIMQKQNTI